MFSSGKHLMLNTQPWAVVHAYGADPVYAGHNMTDGVDGRFASREAAEAYCESGFDRVEFDPFVIDAVALHNPHNPYLYALRQDMDGLTLADWHWHLTELWSGSESPETVHARKVLQRFKGVFGIA